nr:unnamed protein product [Spirometra erinaceieuropaei]
MYVILNICAPVAKDSSAGTPSPFYVVTTFDKVWNTYVSSAPDPPSPSSSPTATAFIVIGVAQVQLLRPKKLPVEFMIENPPSAESESVSIEPLKGSLDLGCEQVLRITWEPKLHQDPKSAVTLNILFKGDTVYRQAVSVSGRIL